MYHLHDARTGKKVELWRFDTLDGAVTALRRFETWWRQTINIVDGAGRILYKRDCADGSIYRWDSDRRAWVSVEVDSRK